MARVIKLLRRTIHSFLSNYHHLAAVAAFLALPASTSILLSQAISFSSPPILQAAQDRLASLFEAAGFPPTAELPTVLHQKLFQALFSAALSLPFAPTFLVLGKAWAVRAVIFRRAGNRKKDDHHAPAPRLCWLYLSMLRAYLCSCTVLILANVVTLAILLVLFNAAGFLGIVSPNAHLLLSAAGAVLYSVALAHVLVACNLAMVVAGAETRPSSTLFPLAKAFSAMKFGGAGTALSLALPANLGMAAVEALFQYRVVRPYSSFHGSLLSYGIMAEAVVIAYMHAVLVVVDVVASCEFYNDCRPMPVCMQEGNHDGKSERWPKGREGHGLP